MKFGEALPAWKRATILRDVDEAMQCLSTREYPDPKDMPMALAELQAELNTLFLEREYARDRRLKEDAELWQA
jgi:hypothetical protein